MKNAATSNCKRCKETPVPSNYASPRQCAFDESGEFTNDNWMCVTANLLRSLCGKHNSDSFRIRRSDQSYASLYVPANPNDIPDGEEIGPWRGGGLISMCWYKERGRVEIMLRVDPRDGGTWDKAGMVLTADEAEAALVNLELAGVVAE